MSEDLHDDVQLLDFVEQLNELRATCGGPSLRKIADTSGRLTALYGERYRDLPVLSPSALSNALNGRRKAAPAWEWVAAFVLSCRGWGWEVGVLRDSADRGPDSLPAWRERWLGTTTTESTQVDTMPVDTIPAGTATAGTTTPGTTTPGTTTPATTTADTIAADKTHGPTVAGRTGSGAAEAERLSGHPNGVPAVPSGGVTRPPGASAPAESLTARRYRGLFGAHGVDLLGAADDELDADAALRLGILLACRGNTNEATAWLQRPAAEENVMAVALVRTDEARLPGRAAEFAYELGRREVDRRYSPAGLGPDVAEVYLEAAARAGHVDACYEIAVRRRAAGKDADAVRWFARAAGRGHRPAGMAEVERKVVWRVAPDVVPEEWLGEA